MKVTAEAEERAALAKTDGILAIGALEAEFKTAREGKYIRVTGKVRARVTQECVVTLEPFDTDITEDVDVRFAFAAPPPAPEPRAGERMSRRRASQAQQERRAQPVPEFPPTRKTIRPIRSWTEKSIWARSLPSSWPWRSILIPQAGGPVRARGGGRRARRIALRRAGAAEERPVNSGGNRRRRR